MQGKNLEHILAQARYAGVYHLPHSGQVAVEAAAEALAFARFTVDFGESAELSAALSNIGQALDFPDWYGKNLDALVDCLADFSWREAPGYVVTIVGADALHAVPDDFAALNEAFAAAIDAWREQGIALWVFYDLRADGLATLPTLA